MITFKSPSEFRNAIGQHFTHAVPLTSGEHEGFVNQRVWDEVNPWCVAKYGASARIDEEDGEQRILLDPIGRWARFGYTYFFRDEVDAMWFKLQFC